MNWFVAHPFVTITGLVVVSIVGAVVLAGLLCYAAVCYGIGRGLNW